MAVTEIPVTTRPLYGGALEALVPTSYIDASDLRPVPSHQEVFVARDNAVDSLIVELNEMAPPSCTSWEAVAKHHFEDIGNASDAVYEAQGTSDLIGVHSVAVLSEESVPFTSLFVGKEKLISTNSDDQALILLRGVQSTAKFNATERDLVYLHLGVLRLKKHATDVLMVHYHAVAPSSDASNLKDLLVQDPALQRLNDCFPLWFTSIRLLDPSLFIN